MRRHLIDNLNQLIKLCAVEGRTSEARNLHMEVALLARLVIVRRHWVADAGASAASGERTWHVEDRRPPALRVLTQRLKEKARAGSCSHMARGPRRRPTSARPGLASSRLLKPQANTSRAPSLPAAVADAAPNVPPISLRPRTSALLAVPSPRHIRTAPQPDTRTLATCSSSSV